MTRLSSHSRLSCRSSVELRQPHKNIIGKKRNLNSKKAVTATKAGPGGNSRRRTASPPDDDDDYVDDRQQQQYLDPDAIEQIADGLEQMVQSWNCSDIDNDTRQFGTSAAAAATDINDILRQFCVVENAVAAPRRHIVGDIVEFVRSPPPRTAATGAVQLLQDQEDLTDLRSTPRSDVRLQECVDRNSHIQHESNEDALQKPTVAAHAGNSDDNNAAVDVPSPSASGSIAGATTDRESGHQTERGGGPSVDAAQMGAEDRTDDKDISDGRQCVEARDDIDSANLSDTNESIVTCRTTIADEDVCQEATEDIAGRGETCPDVDDVGHGAAANRHGALIILNESTSANSNLATAPKSSAEVARLQSADASFNDIGMNCFKQESSAAGDISVPTSNLIHDSYSFRNYNYSTSANNNVNDNNHIDVVDPHMRSVIFPNCADGVLSDHPRQGNGRRPLQICSVAGKFESFLVESSSDRSSSRSAIKNHGIFEFSAQQQKQSSSRNERDTIIEIERTQSSPHRSNNRRSNTMFPSTRETKLSPEKSRHRMNGTASALPASNGWKSAAADGGRRHIHKTLPSSTISSDPPPTFPRQNSNLLPGKTTDDASDIEVYKKKVEELQIALLECAMEYEVKIVEMKMQMLHMKSEQRQKDSNSNQGSVECQTPSTPPPPPEIEEQLRASGCGGGQKDGRAAAAAATPSSRPVEFLKKQLCRMQREKMELMRELSSLKKRERQFDLQRRGLDDALGRVNTLQRELGRREQEIMECQEREKEARVQLGEVQAALRQAQAAQLEPRRLLSLLPALRDWIQTVKKVPRNHQHQIHHHLHVPSPYAYHDPNVFDEKSGSIVCSVTKEIQALQKALSKLAAKK